MKRQLFIPADLFFILLFVFVFGVLSCSKKIEVSSDSPKHEKNIHPASLEVFIENSGSMNGYMVNGSQLKDAIYDYVSDLNRSADTTRLYYINSQIIPYNGSLQSYIKDLDPTRFREAGGNLTSTDLGEIIGRVLKRVDNNTVCMFVSDCILDLPSKDAIQFLTNCEITIKEDVISALKRVPELGVEILKMESNFSGKYFYPDGKVEMLENVKRPYYIWMFGNRNQLAQFNKKVPFDLITKYGLKGIVAFTAETPVNYEIKNKALTGNVASESHGKYEVTIRVDFSPTLQSDGEVQNKQNYSFNMNGVAVEGIYPISDKKSPYTHYVNISIPTGARIAQDALYFNAPKLPKWVKESNDETGTNVKANLDKTIGIKYLIQGVADAYRDDTVLTKMMFKVRNLK